MKSLVSLSTSTDAQSKRGRSPTFFDKIKIPFTRNAHRRGFLLALVYIVGLPAVMVPAIHNYVGVATTYFAYSGVLIIDVTCGNGFLKVLEFYIGAIGAFLMILPFLIGLMISGQTQKIPSIWLKYALVALAASAPYFWNYVIYLYPDHSTVARQGFSILTFFAMQTNDAPTEAGLKNFLSQLFRMHDLPVLVFREGYVRTVFKIMGGVFLGLTSGLLISIFILPVRAEHWLMSNLEKSLRKIENIMVPLIALDSGIVENKNIFKDLVQHDLILESRNLEFSDFIDIKTKIWNQIEDAYILLQPDKLLVEAARVEKYIPEIYFGRLRSQSYSSGGGRGRSVGGSSRGGATLLREHESGLHPEVHFVEPSVSTWQRFKHWFAEDCYRPRLGFSRFHYPDYEACLESVLALFFHVTSLYLVLETNEALLNDGIASNDHMAWGATLRIGNDLLSISKNKSPNIRKYLTEPDIKFFFENAVHNQHHHEMPTSSVRKGFLLSGFNNYTTPRINESESSSMNDNEDGGYGGNYGGGDGDLELGFTRESTPTTQFSPSPVVGMGEKNRNVTRSVHDLNALEVVDIISKSTVKMEQTAELEACMQPLIKWSNAFGPCIGRISQNVAAYIQSLGDSVAAGRLSDRVCAELSEVRYSLKELCFMRRTWQSKTEDVLRINLANMWHQDPTSSVNDPLYIQEMLNDVLGVSIEDYAQMTVTDRGLLWSNLGYVRDKMARFSCTIVVLTSQLHQCRVPFAALLENAGLV